MKKSILVFAGALVLTLTFQNCGQFATSPVVGGASTSLSVGAPNQARVSVSPAQALAGSDITFTVSLDSAVSKDVVVQLQTTPGTAVLATDYEAPPTSVTIPAGSTSAQVAVPTNAYEIPKTDKAFTLSIASVSSGSVDQAAAMGTIKSPVKALQFKLLGKQNCGVTTDDRAVCWGVESNASYGGFNDIVDFDGDKDVVCGVKSTGIVVCAARENRYGELGNGTTTAPASAVATPVLGISTAKSVVIGFNFACALLADQSVACWGRNNQLMFGPTIPVVTTPQRVGPGSIAHIYASDSALFGVTTDKKAYLINNAGGAPGLQPMSDSGFLNTWLSRNFLDVPAASSAVVPQLPSDTIEVAYSRNSSMPSSVCGRNLSGAVYCDGVAMSLPLPATQISGRCALLTDKTVWCHGASFAFSQGDLTQSSTAIARDLKGANASWVSAGSGGTCYNDVTKGAMCNGLVNAGQPGKGTIVFATSTAYASVPTFTPYKSLTLSVYFETCGLLADGSMNCQGPDSGNLIGAVYEKFFADLNLKYVPGTIVGGTQDTLCALSVAGLPVCISHTFSSLTDLGKIVGIAASGPSVCLLNEAGLVYCDGSLNMQNGFVAAGTLTQVQGLGTIKQIVGGTSGRYFCALTVANAVQCWGLNGSGQLGNGTTSLSATASSPVTAIGLEAGVSSIVAGSASACAIMLDSTVKCWGSNMNGMLGVNKLDSVIPTPTTVLGVDHVSQVSVGSESVIFLKTNGRVRVSGLQGMNFMKSFVGPISVPVAAAP